MSPGRRRGRAGAAGRAVEEADALRRWFARAARDLPWRRVRTPWRTWVSELMLQQTTVATVAPRFEAFIAQFPSPAVLAAAPVEQVVEAWAGLGYYARARNLHRAARLVVAQHGGEVPRDPDALRALPGIGAYTAGAILSIAFGVRAACVDGNIRRVIARLDGVDREGRALETRALERVPEEGPGEWNEGLMELGATLCTPRDPRCGSCPLASGCRARREGRTAEIPAPRARAAGVAVEASHAWIERRGLVLLARRGPGLLEGLWEFPGARVGRAGLVAALRAGLGVRGRCVVAQELARVKHVITRHRIDAALYRVAAAGKIRGGEYAETAWVDPSRVTARGLTSAARKLAAVLGLDAGRRPATR